ncbi:hypothetical protein P8452_44917 [Trifolium repens]|nr:hypothetical protein P8452_44917 [Trifolium repens]
MELDQLCKNTYMNEKKPSLSPFDLNLLSEAFHLREMDPNHISSAKKGPSNANDSQPSQLKNQQDKKRRAETSYDPSVSKRLNTRQIYFDGG